MEWISEYIVSLAKGEIFEIFLDLLSFYIQFGFDLLPQDVRDIWTRSYIGELLSEFGSFDGTIDDLPSALAASYAIFTHFFPFKAVLGEVLLCYAGLATIRVVRWLMSFIPLVATG